MTTKYSVIFSPKFPIKKIVFPRYNFLRLPGLVREQPADWWFAILQTTCQLACNSNFAPGSSSWWSVWDSDAVDEVARAFRWKPGLIDETAESYSTRCSLCSPYNSILTEFYARKWFLCACCGLFLWLAKLVVRLARRCEAVNCCEILVSGSAIESSKQSPPIFRSELFRRHSSRCFSSDGSDKQVRKRAFSCIALKM